MKNFFLISLFIFSMFIAGSISALIFYPERTQNFILGTFNLETLLNKKVKNYISKKINPLNQYSEKYFRFSQYKKMYHQSKILNQV